MQKYDISIIVLTWNHLEDVSKPFFKQLFESVEKSRLKVQVVVFDNGSTDGTQNWLRGINKPYLVKKFSEENIGFNHGNNSALELAKGEYIFFMNNDVVISDFSWIDRLHGVVSADKCIAGQQLETANELTNFRGSPTPYIAGWCLAVSRDFLDKYGAWDPKFGLGYFEDVEISARARKNGYFLKGVKLGLEHLGSKSSSDQLDISEQTLVNRAIFRNIMYQFEKKDKLRIVFYYPKNWPFNADNYWSSGVGGSEASLIWLAKELNKLGHVVDIYNDTQVEGNFDEVNYYNCSSFEYHDYSDVFVLFRNSMTGLSVVNSGAKIFWSCDQITTNDWESEIIPYIDKMICISEYHREYVRSRYPINDEVLTYLDIGINGEEYEDQLEKISGKLLFCSVPRRGLEYLLPIYKRIKEKLTDVSLYITSDYTLWGASPENSEYIEMFRQVPDVHFLGKVSRKDLVFHQKTADILSYPSNYDENFCVSAMECMAAGAVPVSTKIGAITTTVGDCGILINELPESPKYQEKFADYIVELLENRSILKEFRDRGIVRSKNYYWKNLVKEWENTFMSVMKNPQKQVCGVCGEKFGSTFHLFKHRIQKHKPKPVETAKPKDISVLIETTKFVEGSINSFTFSGTSFTVKKDISSDVIRVLNEAYGPGIIKNTRIMVE